MTDIREKVAYERAALLLDAEMSMHEFRGELEMGRPVCGYCRSRFRTDASKDDYGCGAYRALKSVAEKIRTYKH